KKTKQKKEKKLGGNKSASALKGRQMPSERQNAVFQSGITSIKKKDKRTAWRWKHENAASLDQRGAQISRRKHNVGQFVMKSQSPRSKNSFTAKTRPDQTASNPGNRQKKPSKKKKKNWAEIKARPL
ncbi:hypothetical protein B1A91_12285, partial [Neisseria meningitidis]